MFYMFQFLINILDRYITIRMSGGSLAAVKTIQSDPERTPDRLNNLLKTIKLRMDC